MKHKRIIVTSLLVIAFVAIVFFLVNKSISTRSLLDQPISPIPFELRRMDSADVNADLVDAIREKDLRFVGIYGVAIAVPGITEEGARFCVEHREWLKMIEGTSDAITSKEQGRLQLLAEKYASQYNTNLFEYLKKNNLLPQELK